MQEKSLFERTHYFCFNLERVQKSSWQFFTTDTGYSARLDSTRHACDTCDNRLRHRTATLTYRQNEALLSDRGDLVGWSGPRSFGEPPAQRQRRPGRRAQSWPAEPGPGGPGGPGVGADGQHACALVSDRESSTGRKRSSVEVVPFCGMF